MKSRALTCLSALTLFAALAIPARPAAQQARYKVVVFDTFGGPQSYISINGTADVKGAYLRVLSSDGTVTGAAETSTPDDQSFCFASFLNDCFVVHAFRWREGVMTDLGVLPGHVSSSAVAISTNGLIAGVSENPNDIDPVLGFPVFRGALWKGSAITDLGALADEGGHTSPANGVNSRGQVIGFAFNATPDPYSLIGIGFQTRAYFWQNGVMQDLGTLGGPDAQALLINEKGQVVGDSYINSALGGCIDPPLTLGAFIWERGKMTDLGNLGGTCTFAFALNNRGQVTGTSNLKGDQAQHPYLWEKGFMKDLGTFGGNFGLGQALNDAGKVVGQATYPGDQVFHAALWSDGSIKDLGTLPGDTFSFASDINARGQVVGVSFDAQGTSFRAFLWEEGRPMLDLNSLLASSGLQLGLGPMFSSGVANINDRGEIVGNAVDANNNFRAILLVPCHEGTEGCIDASEGERSASAATPPRSTASPNRLTSNGMAAWRARLSQRYHMPRLATPKN